MAEGPTQPVAGKITGAEWSGVARRRGRAGLSHAFGVRRAVFEPGDVGNRAVSHLVRGGELVTLRRTSRPPLLLRQGGDGPGSSGGAESGRSPAGRGGPAGGGPRFELDAAGRVRLFRAVGPTERNQIIRYGDFEYSPSGGGKYFSFTEEDAESAGRALYPGDYTIVETTVPRPFIPAAPDAAEDVMHPHIPARGGDAVLIKGEAYLFYDKDAGEWSMHVDDDALDVLNEQMTRPVLHLAGDGGTGEPAGSGEGPAGGGAEPAAPVEEAPVSEPPTPAVAGEAMPPAFSVGDRVTAGAVAIVILAEMAGNYYISHENEKAIKADLRTHEHDLQAMQTANPGLGIEFELRFTGRAVGEAGHVEPVYQDMNFVQARDENAALEKLKGIGAPGERHYVWYPPLVPETDWKSAGLAEFADPALMAFERLRFGGRGLTYDGSHHVNLSDTAQHWALGLRFHVLKPEAVLNVRWLRGANDTEDLATEERRVVGGRVDAVIVAGHAVVPVIAADAQTAEAFRHERTGEILILGGYQILNANIEDVRWLAPDQIELLDTPLTREHAREARRDRAERTRLEQELADYRKAMYPPTVFHVGASVGEDGHNDPEDVRRVSRRLHELGFLDRETTDLDALGEAIYDYQYQVLHVAKPDGRVDPRGATEAALRAGRKISMALP